VFADFYIVYKITMSLLIEFVEWVKAEAEKTDDLIMEDVVLSERKRVALY
jgi:hypothetical protein